MAHEQGAGERRVGAPVSPRKSVRDFIGNAATVAAELALRESVGLEFAGDDVWPEEATNAVAGAPFPILTDANRYAEWRYMGVDG